MKSLVGALVAKYGDTVTTPVPYAAPGRYTIPGLSGRTDNETYMRAFGTAGTIYSIVSLLASAVAAPDWRLYRKPSKDGRVRYTTGDQGSDQRTEVVQHQALNVWNHPNDFYTRHSFVETVQQHSELCGEQWWVCDKAGGVNFPTSLWPVRPDRIEPVPSADKFLLGYVYTGPSGEKVPLDVADVVPVLNPNPMDPYRGLGPVQSILVDIDAMKYSAEWNRNFFINSATPGGIIEVDARLSDTEWDEMTNRWRESHQGVSRAHRVAILEGGAKWVPNQLSMRDMDFAKLRDVSRDVLREAWGIHKSMLGNADDVNRANAQTAEEVFGRWKVIPRLDRIKQALNERYLPMFGATGEGVEFDYVNPLPDDREADNAELTAKATAAQLLASTGLWDPDDILETVGLPAMRTVTQPAAPVMVPAGAGVLSPADGTGADPAEGGDQQMRRRITIRGATPGGQPGQPADGGSDALAAAAAAISLAPVEAALDKAVAAVLAAWGPVQDAMVEQLVEQVRAVVASGDVAGLAAVRPDSVEGASVVAAAMAAVAGVGAAHAARELNAQGLPDGPRVQPVVPAAAGFTAAAGTTAGLLAAGLGITAGRAAARAAGPGQTPDAVAAATRTALEGLTSAAPEAELHGAMVSALNLGRIGTLKTAPDAALYASELMDKNTCDPCREVNGMWLGNTDGHDFEMLDMTYPAGQFVGCDGGPRCRGTVVGVSRPAQTGDVDDGDEVTGMLRALWHEHHMNGHSVQVGAV